MTKIEAYIGKSKNTHSFKWEGGDWSGNISKIFSPYFPSGYEILNRIWAMIHSGSWEGKQLDWGVWGVKMRKKELLAFVAECQ